MQGLLQATKFVGAASKATATAASRSTVAGFRPPAHVKQQQQAGHAAASLRPLAAAAAAVEAPAAVEAVPIREEPETPRSINDAPLQLKFVVPSAVAGAVLGRGGSTVASIKERTGCYVQLTRSGTAVADPRERMLIIAGDNVASIKQSVSMVFEAIVMEGQSDKLKWLRRQPNRVFLQQVIPATCAGKVMGPEGEQIKSIGARTGCSVVVEAKPRNAAFVPFRLVNYLAEHPMQLVAAVASVLDALAEEEKYRPGIREISSVCMKILPISQRRVGNLLGPGGMHIKSLQEVLKVKIGVAEAVDASGLRHVTLWGPLQNLRVAQDVVMLAAGTLPTAGEEAAAQQASSQVVSAPRRGRSQSSGSRSRSLSRVDDDASSVAGSVAPTELGSVAE